MRILSYYHPFSDLGLTPPVTPPPFSKNSILTSCFGIAWEQVIFIHVLLGEALLLIIASHMGAWWIVYHIQNSFPSDILQVCVE